MKRKSASAWKHLIEQRRRERVARANLREVNQAIYDAKHPPTELDVWMRRVLGEGVPLLRRPLAEVMED